MSADARRGSRQFKRMLAVRLKEKPHLLRLDSGKWCCSWRHVWSTPGVDWTPQSAYVDFIEELELLYGPHRGTAMEKNNGARLATRRSGTRQPAGR